MFCSLCTAGSHMTGTAGAEGGADRNSADSDHTVIPFSIAIKRMSEILLYKANECTSKVRQFIALEAKSLHYLASFNIITD